MQRLKSIKSRSYIAMGILGFLLITSFQNCSSFQAIEQSNPSSQSDDAGAQATPTPTTTPTPSPTPVVPSAQLDKTVFYMGRSGAIDAVELDHATGLLRQISTTVFGGSSVGWMAYDKTSESVLAADSANGGKLEVYDSLTNGVLSSRGTQNYLNGIVHFTAAPVSSGFRLFAANYGAGTLSYHRLSGGAPQLIQTITYASGAKAHSSAFDSSRNLLFVATLGLNKIQIYKVSDTALTVAGTISITSPRTVIYDATYDKIFVATEATSGSSYIKGYSITESSPGTYSFAEIASLATSLIAADIKVNHVHGYVMSTSREIGRQAINGMPVTTAGVLDTSRSSFLIPLSQVQPRSLEVTADGQYALVAMNSSGAANVVAFKLNFDSKHQFISSQKVFEQKLANEGYVCATSIPFYRK